MFEIKLSINVHVLRFRTLVAYQNGLDKQDRHRSDCFWRIRLIRVFPVCYSDKQFVHSSPENQHFIWEQKEKSVRNFYLVHFTSGYGCIVTHTGAQTMQISICIIPHTDCITKYLYFFMCIVDWNIALTNELTCKWIDPIKDETKYYKEQTCNTLQHYNGQGPPHCSL